MGEIYDGRGNYHGSVRSNGEIYDEHGDYLGRITQDGEIYDSSGTYLGSIWSNGHIYINGSYVGLIDENGYVYSDGSYVGHIYGLNKNKLESNQQNEPRIENKTISQNETKSREHKNYVRPSSIDTSEEGFIPALIICGALLVGIIYIVVYAIVIALFVGLAVGTVALIGFLVYQGMGAATQGRFKKNPHAKFYSGLIAVAITAIIVIILRSTGNTPSVSPAAGPSSYTEYVEETQPSDDSNEAGYDSETPDDINDDLFADNEGSGNDQNDDWSENDYTADETDYILPQSASSYLEPDDLEELTDAELRLARNEIYARHGRMFNDKELQEYFDSCDWYNGTIEPEDFSENVLNEYEKENLELIVSYEND